MTLEGYDLVMLGILAAAAVLGYFKGMVWQVAWIAGIGASSFVALRFGAVVAPYISQPPPWNRLIAMLGLYVSTSLVVWLLFRVISGAINAVHLSAFDRQLGLLLGLAKGGLLCVVITFFSVTLAPAYRHQIVGSQSGRLVADLIVRADEFLPREIGEAIDPFVRQFEDQFRDGQSTPPEGPAVTAEPAGAGSIWNVVTSAAAWIGPAAGGPGDRAAAGQGQGVAGIAPWGGPTTTTPATTPQPSGGFQMQPPALPQAQPPTPAPLQPPIGFPPSAPSGFSDRARFPTPQPVAEMARQPLPSQPQSPVAYPPPAQGYPIGAQTQLPPR